MNSNLQTFKFDELSKRKMHNRLKRLSQITPLAFDYEFSSLLASYGIMREVGSVNDEIARFLFDSKTNKVVEASSLEARLVKLNQSYGVEIQSVQTNSIEIKAYGVRELLHPEYSFNKDGTVKTLVIFPEAICKIAELNEVELVIVRDWALNSIFEGFDPQKGYYQTNFWELENNDTLLFSRIIKNKQIAFLGTHDFIAHVANVKKEVWGRLSNMASRVEDVVKKLVSTTTKPSMASLILPYTAGVILDDLAQPPSYDSVNHITVLEVVLDNIESRSVPSDFLCTLSRFPSTYEKVIELSRVTSERVVSRNEAKNLVEEMILEIKNALIFEGVDERLGEKLFKKMRVGKRN